MAHPNPSPPTIAGADGGAGDLLAFTLSYILYGKMITK